MARHRSLRSRSLRSWPPRSLLWRVHAVPAARGFTAEPGTKLQTMAKWWFDEPKLGLLIWKNEVSSAKVGIWYRKYRPIPNSQNTGFGIKNSNLPRSHGHSKL